MVPSSTLALVAFGPASASLGTVWIALLAAFATFLAIVFYRRANVARRHAAGIETQLHLVLDSISEGVVVFDRHRNIQLVNDTGRRLLSLDSSDQTYSQLLEQFEFTTPEGGCLTPEQMPSARAQRGDFVQKFPLLRRNKITGATCSHWVTTAPVPGGSDGGIIVVYHDDDERHRIDEARSRLAAIVESSEDAIVSRDADGIVLSWNKGAEKIFGYTAAEMMGGTITRLLPADRLDEEDILRSILKEETVKHFETVRLTKDGRTINVSLSISPIKDAEGRIVGASKIARDVTALRNLESQLRQSQKMEALGQLTGGIAHDFNNLLSIVSGNIELLEQEIYADARSTEEGSDRFTRLLRHAQRARRAATRSAELTRRLLAFSSNEPLRPASTSIEHSIRNVLEMSTRSLGPEIVISTNFEKSLPNVFVDASGLETALLNLVVNARDSMPSGGSLRIATRLLRLDENLLRTTDITGQLYVCTSISDDGSGMSPETLQHAFEPFFTTKPRGRGTGLGLAMVYGFLKQSKGTARIYSELGYGTTVSLYLPVDAELAVPVPFQLLTQHAAKPGATILLVDDELGILELASDYLARLGYDTLKAVDGQSALKIVHENPNIDLMITDIIMAGGMNGAELAQQVLQLQPAIKIVYSSGFPADALAQKKFVLATTNLLIKPYRLAELGALVHTLIGQPVEA